MRVFLGLLFTLSIGLQIVSPQSFAQQPEEIVVIAVVPAGASLDKDKIPFPIQKDMLNYTFQTSLELFSASSSGQQFS